MRNPIDSNSKVKFSFILWWVTVNFFGLPTLLFLNHFGDYVLGGFAMISDGILGPEAWAFIIIILAIGGAVIGAWLGILQSIPLISQIVRSGKWIRASSLGIAVGTPLSFLGHLWFLDSPIVVRNNVIYSVYFSDFYAYIIYSVLLGISIGVSQWLVLRQQVHAGGWWIFVIPICFSLAIVFTHFCISNLQVPDLIAYASPFISLIGVGCITGILLRWLLQHPK